MTLLVWEVRDGVEQATIRLGGKYGFIRLVPLQADNVMVEVQIPLVVGGGNDDGTVDHLKEMAQSWADEAGALAVERK